MEKKYKVVIDRSKWRTGYESRNKTGEGDTYLLNQEGYSCCLGFITKQLIGLPDGQILGLCEPYELGQEIPDLAYEDEYSSYENTTLSGLAMDINDSVDTTPEEKELALIELFKNSEIELTFTGEFTKHE